MDEKEWFEKKRNVDLMYMHYREQADNAISSVIIISSTLVGIIVSFTKPELAGCPKILFFIFGMIPIFSSVFFGVHAKYNYFLGYQKYARSEYKYLESEGKTNLDNIDSDRKEGYQLFEDSNTYFDKGDKYTHFCKWAFFLGLLTIFIFYSLNFFGIS